MNKIFGTLIITLLIVSIFNFTGCKDPLEPLASVEINFLHKIDGQDIVYDTLMYKNAAGNEYEVSEIRWFISDITFEREDGLETMLGEETEGVYTDDMHYIDTDIPSTHKLFLDYLPAGDYKSITMTFGINEQKNISYMFMDHPETGMLWPDVIGGGYHYMMLNGYFMHSKTGRTPYNYHLGIGQTYDGNGDITGFVQNYVVIKLDNSEFSVMEEGTISMNITMNVENWFQNPQNFDIEAIGGSIMQNQAAQEIGKANAVDVFTLTFN